MSVKLTLHHGRDTSTPPDETTAQPRIDRIDLTAAIGSCTLIVIGATLVVSPWAGVATALALLAYFGARRGRKHHPQALGVITTVIFFELFAVITSTLFTPLMLLSGSTELGATFILASPFLALVSTLCRSEGVHRGWTVAFAHIPLVAGLFLTGVIPQHTSLIAGSATIVGLVIIALRTKNAAPRKDTTRTNRLVRISALLLSGGLLAGMMTFSFPATQAKAWDVFGIKDSVMCGMFAPNLGVQPVGTGVEALIPNRNLAGVSPLEETGEAKYMNVPMQEFESGKVPLSSYTLYEIAGLRGMQFVNWAKDQEGENTYCQFGSWASVTAGGMINGAGLMLLQIVIALKETAQAPDPFSFLYDDFGTMVGGLFDALIGLACVGILIGIIVGAYRAVRGNSLGRTFGQVGGVLGTALIAGLAYGAPAVEGAKGAFEGAAVGSLLRTIDEYGSTINSWVADASLTAVTATGESSMCNKPADGQDIGQRYSSCLLAETFAYQPWANVTFGADARGVIEPEAGSLDKACYNDFDGCGDLRTYLLAQIGGPDITQRMNQCLVNEGFDEEADETDNYEALVACEPYHAVAANLISKADSGSAGASMLASFRAQGGFMQHFTTAQMSIVGILIVGLGLAIFAVRTIYWHGRLFVLWLLGPVVLAFGSFRGGEQGVTWFFNLIESVTVRIVYGIITTVIILIVSITSSMDMPGGYKMVTMAFLIFTIIGMIRKFEAWAKPPLADNDANPSMFSGAFLGSATGAMVPSLIRGGVRGAGKVAGGAGRLGLKGAGFATLPARNAGKNGLESVQGRWDAWRTERNSVDDSFAGRERARIQQAGNQFGNGFLTVSPVPQTPVTNAGGGKSNLKPTSSQPAHNSGGTRAADSVPATAASRFVRSVDSVRRTAGSTRRLFSDPNGQTRQAVHQRESLVRQAARDENAFRDDLQEVNQSIMAADPTGATIRGVSQVGHAERRALRKQANQLTAEQQRAALRETGTMDERMKRIAERKKQRRDSSK